MKLRHGLFDNWRAGEVVLAHFDHSLHTGNEKNKM